jgi:hypothetical protein
MGWVVNAKPRPLYPGKEYNVPVVQEARWAPVPVWISEENFTVTGIRPADRPAPTYLEIIIGILLSPDGKISLRNISLRKNKRRKKAKKYWHL